MAAQCNIPNSYCSALFTGGSFLSFHQQTSTTTLTLLVQQPPIPTTTQATTTTLYRKDPQKCKDKKCPMCFDTLLMAQVMLGCRASCGPIAKSAKSGAGCSFDDGPAVER